MKLRQSKACVLYTFTWRMFLHVSSWLWPFYFLGSYFLNKTMKNISELNIFIHATTVHMMVDLHVQVDIDTFFV